ncbi:MAG: hypothetical protein J6M90_06390 [Oscillospiraceae bacterium]|nr:hypothetical protein [Oscillospiraceae bacterium]MBQ9209913.1 hypothetical protein [Oscillospiraceae bacterium]
MSFREKLRKLLGIDENTTTHKIIISSLSEENDKKEIVDFINENTKITPCVYTASDLISKGYQKVQSQVGPLFNQLPAFATCYCNLGLKYVNIGLYETEE